MMNLSAYKLNFKLKEPISISFHTFHYRETVIINLSFQSLTGIGEAAPFKPITGDSQEEVLTQAKLLTQIPLDPTTDTVEKLHEYMDQQHITRETLRAAVDFAYHDLVAKMKGIPVYKLYKPTPRLIDNSVTIFVKDTFKEVAADAKHVFTNYPDLKILKIKLKGEGDIERARAVKSVAPEGMKFLIDANQGFADPKKAVEDLTKIGDILEDVILVEQPCPKEDLQAMKYVTDNVKNMLVFADESAATVDDARKVIEAKAAHGVNIKLQKAGGIWPSKQIAKMCIENGLQIMTGCMLEGPIGIAAGIHFATSTENLILTDLDADLDIQDSTNTKSPYKHGQRIPLESPGFGISLDVEKINELQKIKEAVFEQII